jgi:hypothetical protein
MAMILAVSVRRAAGGVLVRVDDAGHLGHVASSRWDAGTPEAIAGLVAAAGDEPISACVASATDDDVRESLCATMRSLLPLDPLGTTPKATRRAVIGHAQASDGDVDAQLLGVIGDLAAVESATLRDALLAVVWSEQQRRARALRDGG